MRSKIYINNHIIWFIWNNNTYIKSNCPAGCPCNSFDCLETTTSADITTSTAPATSTTSITTTSTTSTTAPASPNAVLVLSNYQSGTKPMVITFDGKKFLVTIFFWTKISQLLTKNFSGVVNDDLDFEYESGTHANGGCSVTLKGQFWYLGGFQAPRKVALMFKFLRIRFILRQANWSVAHLWDKPICRLISIEDSATLSKHPTKRRWCVLITIALKCVGCKLY